MADAEFQLDFGSVYVVGSIGSSGDLLDSTATKALHSCDIAEIRLDLLRLEGGEIDPTSWSHLAGFPLLFTARRLEEGGAGALDAETRMAMLMRILDEAALIDIEVASIGEMTPLIELLGSRGIPWIASYHDFQRLPDRATLEAAKNLAIEAGATVFKAAAFLSTPHDIATLTDFQLDPHEIPVSTMGMGPLAPVSRLLCAQAGSILNYGYLGKTATAPGQWDCALLKTAISRLSSIKNQHTLTDHIHRCIG